MNEANTDSLIVCLVRETDATSWILLAEKSTFSGACVYICLKDCNLAWIHAGPFKLHKAARLVNREDGWGSCDLLAIVACINRKV